MNTNPTAATPSRTLCVWLPDWPIQRLRLRQPELHREAIALSIGDARSERIAACSDEARRLGVAVGQRTPDAESLAGPGRLRLLPYRAADDRRGLERLALGCERFAPVTSLEDAEEPSALLLDVAGLAMLWADRRDAGEGRLAREVAIWINAGRLKASVAIASTVGLALAVARWNGTNASEAALVIPPHRSMTVAKTLPIEAVRVADHTCRTLRDLGIETVGQLLALPRSTLPARFGPELTHRLDQLVGDAAEPVESFRAEPPLVAVWDFETAVTNDQAIRHAVGVLLKRLGETMQHRRVGALRLLVIYTLDAPAGAALSETVALRMARPTNAPRELIELAALHAERLRLRYAVSSIRASVGSAVPVENRQRTLFEDSARDNPHELALLVNRIAGRVGPDHVTRVEKRRSVDPEHAYAYLPATDTEPTEFRLTPAERARARRLPLTLWGTAGDCVCVETDSLGMPQRVVLQRSHRVVRSWGPERVETGWWRRHGPQRDAYWVELDTGSRLWLWRDLRSGRWRLAGEFS